MDRISLDKIINRTNKVNRLPCEIKKYISVKEKFNFIDEYEHIISETFGDTEFSENIYNFIRIIIFNLLIVKYYTNIDIDISYDDFDMLKESGVIDIIAENIGRDYEDILMLIK